MIHISSPMQNAQTPSQPRLTAPAGAIVAAPLSAATTPAVSAALAVAAPVTALATME